MLTAIIVAAGRGVRLGSKTPKAFVALGGEPMFCHSVRVMESMRETERVLLVVPPDCVEKAKKIVKSAGFRLTEVVPGGKTRAESVRAASLRVGEDSDWTLVHDAARPFLTAALARRVLSAAKETGAAAAALTPVDTVKRRLRGGTTELLDRDALLLLQTPQAFRSELLTDAMSLVPAAARKAMPDETTLVEFYGAKVEYIAGDPDNFKITTAADLGEARKRMGEKK